LTSRTTTCICYWLARIC